MPEAVTAQILTPETPVSKFTYHALDLNQIRTIESAQPLRGPDVPVTAAPETHWILTDAVCGVYMSGLVQILQDITLLIGVVDDRSDHDIVRDALMHQGAWQETQPLTNWGRIVCYWRLLKAYGALNTRAEVLKTLLLWVHAQWLPPTPFSKPPDPAHGAGRETPGSRTPCEPGPACNA